MENISAMAWEGHDDQGPSPLRDEAWVTPKTKLSALEEVLAEGKKNLEWVIEEGDHEY